VFVIFLLWEMQQMVLQKLQVIYNLGIIQFI